MTPTTIEIRLRDAEELRHATLDSLHDGALFVPGAYSVAAGSPVLLRVHVENPATTTILAGTVVWRRLPQRAGDASAAVTLRAGIGVALAASMRPRALFLERLARGSANEGRTAARYPSDLSADLLVRASERPSFARVVDVAVRGARVHLEEDAFVDPGSRVALRVAIPRSGEIARDPLNGRVMWLDRATHREFGVRLDLETTEERLVWAKVVTRARESLEERPLRLHAGDWRGVG